MKKISWFGVSLIILLLDQLSKHLAQIHLSPYNPQYILSFLNLTLGYNSGAAFSFLSDTGSWHHYFFTIFNSILGFLIILWMIKLPKTANLHHLALSLILSGALGNLYDRFTRGYVVDFIDLHYKNYHWPIFNVADSVIFIGAAILLLCLPKQKK